MPCPGSRPCACASARSPRSSSALGRPNPADPSAAQTRPRHPSQRLRRGGAGVAITPSYQESVPSHGWAAVTSARGPCGTLHTAVSSGCRHSFRRRSHPGWRGFESPRQRGAPQASTYAPRSLLVIRSQMRRSRPRASRVGRPAARHRPSSAAGSSLGKSLSFVMARIEAALQAARKSPHGVHSCSAQSGATSRRSASGSPTSL